MLGKTTNNYLSSSVIVSDQQQQQQPVCTPLDLPMHATSIDILGTTKNSVASSVPVTDLKDTIQSTMSQSPQTTSADTTEATKQSGASSILVTDLKDATRFPSLWYRIHVFLFDLQHFAQRSDSRDRLDSVADKHYIGLPYFNAEEAETFKNAVVDHSKKVSDVMEEKLTERLNRRMTKRIDSGDFRVCAAHDLGSILDKLLNVDSKRLAKDKVFLNLVNTKGLDLGEKTWQGLPAKSFAPRNKNKKKGKGK